jgi:hypothetical protein
MYVDMYLLLTFWWLGMGIFEYVLWYIHIREYAGLTIITANDYYYNYHLFYIKEKGSKQLEYK